jgi:hypothetical protein
MKEKVNPTENQDRSQQESYPIQLKKLRRSRQLRFLPPQMVDKKKTSFAFETDLLKIMISTKGGSIAGWEMKNYTSWHDKSGSRFSGTN